MKPKTSPIQRRTVAQGIRRTARELGVSPSHLSQVVSGKRRSLRLARRLREMGFEVAECKDHAAERMGNPRAGKLVEEFHATLSAAK